MPVLSLCGIAGCRAGADRIDRFGVDDYRGAAEIAVPGALSDIYGRKMLLRIGVVAFGLPPFIYPFISDLNALTALRFVHGLATAIFAPSALPRWLIFTKERRGRRWEPIRPVPSPVPSLALSWRMVGPCGRGFQRHL